MTKATLALDHLITELQGQRPAGISRWWASHCQAVAALEWPSLPIEQTKRGPWWLRRAAIPTDAQIVHGSYYRRFSGSVHRIVNFHDDTLLSGGLRNAFRKRVVGACLAEADRIICSSRWAAGRCKLRFPNIPCKRLEVLPLPVEPLPEPIPLTGFEYDGPVALWVGKRGGYKGGTTAEEALALLPDWALLSVGGEPLPKGWNGRHFHGGQVSNAQLAWCYQRADVLWYPSASEGFGYPPLEARMLGCPVLAANGHAVAELAGDDPGVITAEQPQARWLSEASQSLLRDSIPVRRDICSRFGVESYRNALAALYEQR